MLDPKAYVVENQFMKFAATPKDVTVKAGMVCVISGSNTVNLPTDPTSIPFGLLLQDVVNLSFAGNRGRDLNKSYCDFGEPVGVAHSGGIFETDQYADYGSNGIAAGSPLYCSVGDGLLTDGYGTLNDVLNDGSVPYVVAIAMGRLSSAATTASARLLIKLVI